MDGHALATRVTESFFMSQEYIHIIASRKTPRRKPVTRKPRRSSPDRGGIIEIIDTSARTGNRSKLQDASANLRCKGGADNIVKDSPRIKTNRKSAVQRLKGASGPKPEDINYGDTLSDCSTVEEVRAWLLEQQTIFQEKVDRGFARRRLLPETRSRADAVLHGIGATPAFMIGNDHLALKAWEKLREHFSAFVSANSANEVALITFIDGEGGTSMDRPVIELRKSRKLVNEIMRKMTDHWFGMVDLAFFWTIPHADGGLHLQRHEHVVGWGVDFINEAIEVAEKQSSKLAVNVTKLPRIKVKRGYDCSDVNLARLAAYLLKAPAKGKNWFEYPDGKQIMNHTEAKDRYIQYLRLGQQRSMLALEDLIIGGGDGVKIKGSMVRDMRSLATADARNRETIHPDLIPTFWENFNQELGQSHWSLPAILRR